MYIIYYIYHLSYSILYTIFILCQRILIYISLNFYLFFV